MTAPVDVTNLLAKAILSAAKHAVDVEEARYFFHPGWQHQQSYTAAVDIYLDLRSAILGRPDDGAAYLALSALWRLVHSPADWHCFRCMTRASTPPGQGHVTVSDINPVCADDLCVDCLGGPPDDDDMVEPRMPVRHIRLGEAS